MIPPINFFNSLKSAVGTQINNWIHNTANKNFWEIGKSNLPSLEKRMLVLFWGLLILFLSGLYPFVSAYIPDSIELALLMIIVVAIPMQFLIQNFQFNLYNITKDFFTQLLKWNGMVLLFALVLKINHTELPIEILQSSPIAISNTKEFTIFMCASISIYLVVMYFLLCGLAIVNLPIIYVNTWLQKIVAHILMRNINILSSIVGLAILGIILWNWHLFKAQLGYFQYIFN